MSNDINIRKMDPSLFSWSKWRIGGEIIIDLSLILREEYITKGYMRQVIRKYAIGYCDGEALLCRPKLQNKAIMIYRDEICGWFHLTNSEFDKIF